MKKIIKNILCIVARRVEHTKENTQENSMKVKKKKTDKKCVYCNLTPVDGKTMCKFHLKVSKDGKITLKR